ncbi:MAG: TIGR03086 family metal-binding protein [Gemmatimonadota bacterium]
MDVRTQGPWLLARAVRYTLAMAGRVTPELLPRATPCAGWDLRMLLSHLTGSLSTLSQGLAAGSLNADPWPGPPDGTAAGLRHQARRLLAACDAAPAGQLIAIGGHKLTAGILAAAGAIEAAVHGWDISAACGDPEPVPPDLAAGLLAAAALLIPPGTRHGLFAAPLPVPAPPAPGRQLLAFLGRNPDRPSGLG